MKKFFLIAAMAVAGLGANAQVFWKVSGNDAKGCSYLFGTHHVAPTSMIDSIGGVPEAITACDAIFGEIDMTGDQMAMQQIVMSHAMAPVDSTLTAVLKPAEVALLDSILGKYTAGQLKAEMLAPMKPAMVASQLAMLQNMTAFPNFNPAEQLDTRIQQIAAEKGKTPEGFETADFQFSLLMGDPIAEQARDLVESLEKDSEAVGKAQELAKAYMDQDLNALSAILFDPEEMDAETIDKLITNRNNNWIKIMSERLPQQSMFVAVGVGHLIDEKGLIEQLRSLGYTVEPVK